MHEAQLALAQGGGHHGLPLATAKVAPVGRGWAKRRIDKASAEGGGPRWRPVLRRDWIVRNNDVDIDSDEGLCAMGVDQGECKTVFERASRFAQSSPDRDVWMHACMHMHMHARVLGSRAAMDDDRKAGRRERRVRTDLQTCRSNVAHAYTHGSEICDCSAHCRFSTHVDAVEVED